MITMQVEPWDTFWQDGAQLTYNSYAETGEGLVFDPDVSGYRDLYTNGRLIVLTVRDDRTMVGYLMFVVMQHFHARSIRTAFEEGLYLAPEYRKGTLGIRLLNLAEAMLRTLDCGRVYYTNRPQRDLSKLYSRRGLTKIAEQWVKELQ